METAHPTIVAVNPKKVRLMIFLGLLVYTNIPKKKTRQEISVEKIKV
jgi:hypothetical protein